VQTNRDKRTLMDKMIALLTLVGIEEPYYFVADSYYLCRKIVKLDVQVFSLHRWRRYCSDSVCQSWRCPQQIR
jgi:hypothetical protein